MGSSCGTVTPGSNEACCATKVVTNTADAWCEENFPLVRHDRLCSVLVPQTLRAFIAAPCWQRLHPVHACTARDDDVHSFVWLQQWQDI